MPHVIPTWVAFNPGNWRHLAVSTEKEMTLWNVEQSDDLYYVTKRFVIHVIELRVSGIIISGFNIHRVREKKRPQYSRHNFDKYSHSSVIFGANHPDTSVY